MLLSGESVKEKKTCLLYTSRGGATVSGDYIYLATPQVENGPCVSSFIISGGRATTRASDLVSIPTRNNLYKLPFTFLLEIHKNWAIAPNAAPRVWDIACLLYTSRCV